MKKQCLLLTTLMAAGSMFAQLPAGMVSLLPAGVKANINNTRKVTQEKNLVVAGEKANGYKAFFAATDEDHGEELWVTDGTPEGTHLVKDINPGTGTSDVRWMERFNDKVVFAADDGEGLEAWISDGTETGTYMISNIHPWKGSEPRGFVQVNETQFIFGAVDDISEAYSSRGRQWWLYVSDGTEAGTQLIYQCETQFPGQDNHSYQSPWCRVGRRVFFKANDKEGTVGGELWVTDGTTDGTHLVKDINLEKIASGTADAAIDGMINFYNEKLFFKAFSITSNNEPWATDGTEDGTYEIYDSNPTVNPDNGFPNGGGASDCGPYPYKGKVYFRGYTTDAGCELAATNLERGDFKIFDINTNTPSVENQSFADVGIEFDGVYMFCANSGVDINKPETNYGGELHYTDGENLYLQSDLAPGVLHHWVKELTVVSGSLYWWNEGADVIEQKQKLFRLDSKDGTPECVTNFSPDGDRIHTLRNLGGDLLFVTNDESKSLYYYHYRKEGYDAEKDADNLDIEFRTRAEIEQESGIKAISTGKAVLYPNPTNDQFSFNVAGDVENVKIIDTLGRIVKEETQLQTNTVNVASLVSGVYKVIITSTEGTSASSLIIK